MMSKRLEVVAAVKALMAAACPAATVMGLDGDDAAPGVVPDGGRIIVRAGDPREPEYTLSPLTYHYEHRIPVEVSITCSATLAAEQRLDTMLVAIGTAVGIDRTLGGNVEWLDTMAPETDDIAVFGERGEIVARPPRGAELVLIASYTTSGPLA